MERMESFNNWSFDYWSLFFSMVSLILFILALFIPEQRIVIFGFFIISTIFAVILYYSERHK